MKKFLATMFVVGNLFFASTVNAAIEIYTGEGKATLSEAETQEKAIERAKTYALREAREKAGVYIKSQSRLRDLELIEDEVVTLTGGILKVKDTKTAKTLVNDVIQIIVTVTVTIDSEDLQREIDKFLAQNPNRKPAPPPVEHPNPVKKVEPPAPPPPPVEQPTPVEKIEPPAPSVEIVKPTAPVENVTPPTPPVADDKVALSKQKSDEALELLRAGKAKEALPLCDEAIQLNLNNVSAYNNRGWAYDNLKDYGKALENYNKAIELNPNYKWAYNNRGNTYREQKKYKQALADLDKAIEIDPNLAMAYANRGWTYDDMGKPDEALENYNKAIELNPNDGLYYRNRGRCYRKLGKLKEAQADLKKAKELGYPD